MIRSWMRRAAPALAFATLLTPAASHADGYVWEKVGGSMTATATYHGKSVAVNFPSTGFLFNQNVLSPVTNSVGSLYLSLQGQVYTAVGDAVRSYPEYRSHTASFRGAMQLSVSQTAGNAYADISFTGPVAGATVDIAGSSYGIGYSCRLNVSTGVMSFSGGQLDLLSGSISGLALTGIAPTHSESCTTSLSWIPVLGPLFDTFATKIAGRSIDSKIATFMAMPAPKMAPQQFMGLDQALAGVSLVIDGVNVADFIRNNLAAFFRDNTLTIYLGEAPLPGAYVSADRLRISFSKQAVALTITEFASYRQNMICKPPQTACIPT